MLFLDSSSLAKAYIDETGSPRVLDLLAQATTPTVCVLAEPEVISAMNRLRREQKMSEAQYRTVRRQLQDDLPSFEIIDLNRGVLDLAAELLEATPLRASDALHVACAQQVGADIFLTSDKLQYAGAKAIGLNALDPATD